MFEHTAEGWKANIAKLASFPNVHCKISGVIARIDKESEDSYTKQLEKTINYCLDTFGPDRVIFGGDWPVCKLGTSLSDWFTAIKEIISIRSEEDQKKLMRDNAIKFYPL